VQHLSFSLRGHQADDEIEDGRQDLVDLDGTPRRPHISKTELDGKKHAKAFTGSDEELGALIAWLQAQKTK
jgi:hypothetical protein